MAQQIDFYHREVYHCQCLRRFLEDVYTKHCLRGTNKILEPLQKQQDIMLKCEIFMSKKFKRISHNCLQQTFWQLFD